MACFVSSAALFYIEQVGVVIEEPFSSLALTSMAKAVITSVGALGAAHADALILAWTCMRRSYDQEKSSNREHLVINLNHCPS